MRLMKVLKRMVVRMSRKKGVAVKIRGGRRNTGVVLFVAVGVCRENVVYEEGGGEAGGGSGRGCCCSC